MTGRIIAVVGPSGVGKDSVMAALAAHDPRLALARRVITRPGDAGGEDFDGVSVEQFFARAARSEFVLSWTAHGLHYGIPKAVETQTQNGRDVLANLSRGVLAVAAVRFPRVEVLQLGADRAILAARLTARGRETPQQIEERLDRSPAPLPDGLKTHFIDNNGALADTVNCILALLYPTQTTFCPANGRRT